MADQGLSPGFHVTNDAAIHVGAASVPLSCALRSGLQAAQQVPLLFPGPGADRYRPVCVAGRPDQQADSSGLVPTPARPVTPQCVLGPAVLWWTTESRLAFHTIVSGHSDKCNATPSQSVWAGVGFSRDGGVEGHAEGKMLARAQSLGPRCRRSRMLIRVRSSKRKARAVLRHPINPARGNGGLTPLLTAGVESCPSHQFGAGDTRPEDADHREQWSAITHAACDHNAESRPDKLGAVGMSKPRRQQP